MPTITLAAPTLTVNMGAPLSTYLPGPGDPLGCPGVTSPTWALTWVSTLVCKGGKVDNYSLVTVRIAKNLSGYKLDIPERSWNGGLIFIESLDFLVFYNFDSTSFGSVWFLFVANRMLGCPENFRLHNDGYRLHITFQEEYHAKYTFDDVTK